MYHKCALDTNPEIKMKRRGIKKEQIKGDGEQ